NLLPMAGERTGELIEDAGSNLFVGADGVSDRSERWRIGPPGNRLVVRQFPLGIEPLNDFRWRPGEQNARRQRDDLRFEPRQPLASAGERDDFLAAGANALAGGFGRGAPRQKMQRVLVKISQELLLPFVEHARANR